MSAEHDPASVECLVGVYFDHYKRCTDPEVCVDEPASPKDWRGCSYYIAVAALDVKASWDAEHSEPSVEDLIAECEGRSGGYRSVGLYRAPDGMWRAVVSGEVRKGDTIRAALLALRDAMRAKVAEVKS